MAGMNDIKARIKSVESTMQITKAMELVATSKLRRAKETVERTRPFYQILGKAIDDIASISEETNSIWFDGSRSPKTLFIVFAGDRGLAGGYNSNIIKMITRHETWKKEDVVVYAIGSKGRDALARSGYEVKEDWSDIVEEPAYADAMVLTERLLKSFEEGEIGEIYLAYTAFKSTVTHVPTLLKLLPVAKAEASEEEQEVTDNVLMNFEPEEEAALDLLIPKYITSLIYGGLVEAVASENGARMQAMDNATSNAEEMISDLTLKYNRARQSSITQELTEIIAGAEAIS